MAEEEDKMEKGIRPSFPTGRVKKIMKFDKDINKINSDALFLVSCSTDLFLRFLSEKSAAVAVEKKRKTVNLEHLRAAVKRHQPTGDFLLDSLPLPAQPPDRQSKDRSETSAAAEKPAPPHGSRRIDDFFRKQENTAAVEIHES